MELVYSQVRLRFQHRSYQNRTGRRLTRWVIPGGFGGGSDSGLEGFDTQRPATSGPQLWWSYIRSKTCDHFSNLDSLVAKRVQNALPCSVEKVLSTPQKLLVVFGRQVQSPSISH